MIYSLFTKVLEKLKIDDPLEASAVHGAVGVWSTLCIGILDNDTGVIYTGSFEQLYL